MKIINIAEIAIAVENIDKATKFFESILDTKFNHTWEMPQENMRVNATQCGKTQLQLLQTTSPEGVIGKFIKKHGEGIHHIAFEVQNLEETVNELLAKGIEFIPAKPVFYSKGKYIFIHPKYAHGVLIELLEFNTAI